MIMRTFINTMICASVAAALAAPALAETTTIVKKRTYETTRENGPAVVISPDGIAVGSIESEECKTKTVRKETDDKVVTKTTKKCR
jgi:hypothetical protein